MEKLGESLGEWLGGTIFGRFDMGALISFCCAIASLFSIYRFYNHFENFTFDTFCFLGVLVCLSLCLWFFALKLSRVEFPENAKKDEMIQAGKKHFKQALKHAYIIWILFLIEIFYLEFADNMPNSSIEIATAIAFSVSVGFVYFESRNIGSPCEKCGLYNSYVLINKERLTQSKITERKKIRRNDGSTRYEYTDYIVGKERLLYQCQKCGERYTITQSYKEKP